MNKRIIALLLAIVMVFSTFCTVAFADNNQPTDEPVAELYLCSLWNAGLQVPHVFVYFKNLTGNTIRIGAYDCPAYDEVSIGTFGMTVGDMPGIYYNLERARNKDIVPNNFICCKTTVTASQLSSITSYICSFNFWDPVFFNCCYFAISVWNLGGSMPLFPIVMLPWIARFEILLAGKAAPFALKGASTSEIYKQTGIGSGATLKLATNTHD